jgi:dihydrodipicolinate synthase/N-acetylneuraminate lyase
MDLAVPIFTGVNLDPATLGRLSRVHNIVAIKEEAELNPKQITAFLNATPEDFIIYNGSDSRHPRRDRRDPEGYGSLRRTLGRENC